MSRAAGIVKGWILSAVAPAIHNLPCREMRHFGDSRFCSPENRPSIGIGLANARKDTHLSQEGKETQGCELSPAMKSSGRPLPVQVIHMIDR
jgi:hypothetical protein